MAAFSQVRLSPLSLPEMREMGSYGAEAVCSLLTIL